MKAKIISATNVTQLALHTAAATVFDEAVTGANSVYPPNADQIVTTSPTVGDATAVGSPSIMKLLVTTADYDEPASTAVGIPAAVVVSSEVQSTSIKIKSIWGDNPNTQETGDLYLQIWTFPVVANGLVTTGTLEEHDVTTAAHQLVWSHKIFAALQFERDLELEGLYLNNAIVAVSLLENEFNVPPLGISMFVLVEADQPLLS